MIRYYKLYKQTNQNWEPGDAETSIPVDFVTTCKHRGQNPFNQQHVANQYEILWEKYAYAKEKGSHVVLAEEVKHA
jgi:hypothetical protein